MTTRVSVRFFIGNAMCAVTAIGQNIPLAIFGAMLILTTAHEWKDL